ncbi:MAG: cell division protein BolA [Candidatus Sedimenticola sp. 20ELBAFRAG]
MTVCSRVKGYMRGHERVADFFSLLAVALLFGTIWLAIEYQGVIFQWTKDNIIVHGSALIAALVLDVLLIFVFLNIGSARLADGEEDACFGTFRGRRHGGTSIGTAFSNWVDHIEHVNKKHR